MSKTRPIRQWEYLDESDHEAGRSWIVQSEHAGHRMTVVGRVFVDNAPTSMFVVACECGEEFRMAHPTIDRAVSR